MLFLEAIISANCHLFVDYFLEETVRDASKKTWDIECFHDGKKLLNPGKNKFAFRGSVHDVGLSPAHCNNELTTGEPVRFANLECLPKGALSRILIDV